MINSKGKITLSAAKVKYRKRTAFWELIVNIVDILQKPVYLAVFALLFVVYSAIGRAYSKPYEKGLVGGENIAFLLIECLDSALKIRALARKPP